MTPLEYAISQIGTTEYPPGTNHVIYNTRYYGRDVSGKGYPWCMTFVQDCHSQAGTPLPYKTASCTMLWDWYKKNDPKRIVTKPQAGDVVIWKFSAKSYHTGIVESVDGNSITDIEGNTGYGNEANGGAVMRRTRSKSLAAAFIRPFDVQPETTTTTGGGKGMDIVKGSTTNEKKMVNGVQEAVGAVVDGQIGTQTMSDIACMLNAPCFPLTLKIYSAPVIIANDIVPFAAKGAKLSNYRNTLNGSFYAGGQPCSILIQDGVVRQKYACHASYGNPESVLFKKYGGEVGMMRVRSTDELPAGIKWAVGGCGLLSYYDPTAEGFCKLKMNGRTEDFSDVLRTTNHAMLGYKNGHMYLVYCASMSGAQVNTFAKKLGLQLAIMLDGGHVAGINGTESFAQINVSAAQQYMIQGV